MHRRRRRASGATLMPLSHDRAINGFYRFRSSRREPLDFLVDGSDFDGV
jgi:hypothetical protein